ncbi:uncharacterized protein LOC144365575 [Ictidomys tridecemlineatus]
MSIMLSWRLRWGSSTATLSRLPKRGADRAALAAAAAPGAPGTPRSATRPELPASPLARSASRPLRAGQDPGPFLPRRPGCRKSPTPAPADARSSVSGGAKGRRAGVLWSGLRRGPELLSFAILSAMMFCLTVVPELMEYTVYGLRPLKLDSKSN